MILTARKTLIPADAYDLAPRMRAEDVRECKSSSGKDPLEALLECSSLSCPAYTVITDDDDQIVVAMFGVIAADAVGSVGVVWLLASDLAKVHSKEFIKQSPEWIAKLHKRYPCLWNWCDARNTTHIGWLKLMGANFIGEHIHGEEKLLFKEFLIV